MKIRIQRHWFLLIPLIILTWATEIHPQFELSLTPLLVELEMAPGAKKEFKLDLMNESNIRSISLIAYAADLQESEEGAYTSVEKGESEFSCADWMQLSDSSFTLEPNSSKEIKIQIQAPRDVFGGRYGAVVFEVVPEGETRPEGDRLGAVTYSFQMAAFVEVTMKRFGGLVRKAIISDFEVGPVEDPRMLRNLGGDGLAFSASVKNEGNIHLIGKGTLVIKDKEGRTKRRVPLGGGRGSVIPGATVNYRSFLKKPPPGEYTAQAQIDFGGMSPARADIPFVVSRTKDATSGSFVANAPIALDIKPELLELTVPSRGFRAINFIMRNLESDTVEVKAYVKELGYDRGGSLVVSDSSETGRSCTEWISLEPQEFMLAPDGRGRVALTLQAPPEVEGGYYACVVLDAVLGESEVGAISTPFYIPVILSVPPNLDRQGRIVDVKIEATAGKPATVTALFENTGNVHLNLKGLMVLKFLRQPKSTDKVVDVTPPKYEDVGTATFEEIEQSVLPGQMRIMQAGYPEALEAGKYKVEVIVNYGGSAQASFEKEFRPK